MIFAPFVGVNHHGQTTCFGCAFFSDETFDSFVWLLKTWLAALPNGPPHVIITDQDQAMTKAISEVLPNAFHKYCIWHILKKFLEKTSVAFMKNNYDSFSSCIRDSECEEEFDRRWYAKLERSDQTDNEWLKKMYELRGKWIPAYVNKYFSTGMSSSQMVESEHAFFKHYCSKENSLMDFVTRFNRAVAQQRHEELLKDHKDLNETPVLNLGMPMETQMAQLYTRTYFGYFEVQLRESNKYCVDVLLENDLHGVYKTKRVFANNLRMRTLVHDKISNIVTCSCKMFEFKGIPCRHILVFLVKQIMELPKEYILKRWTKFSRVHKQTCQGQEGGDSSLIMRHNNMLKLAYSLIDQAAISIEGTEFVTKSIKGLMENVKELNLSDGQSSIKNHIIAGTSQENRYLDPLQAKTKGSEKRLISWRDKKGKVRHCSKCGSTKHTKKLCTSARSKVVEVGVANAFTNVEPEGVAFDWDLNT